MNFLKTLAVLTLILITSCGTKKTDALDYFSYETECLNNEFDGRYIVRAWGKGNKEKDALEQAKKNALNDLLFKGIRRGKSDCHINPLVVEVNARKNHETYFDNFFSKTRIYSRYISKKNGPYKKKFISEHEIVYEISLQIELDMLKEKLIKDEIINH